MNNNQNILVNQYGILVKSYYKLNIQNKLLTIRKRCPLFNRSYLCLELENKNPLNN